MRDQTVYLDGIRLTDVHPAIILQHVEERAPEINIRTADRAGAPGLFVMAAKPTVKEIDIVFAVRERLDFAVRAAAVSAAAAWAAAGGWLTMESRPGLRIRVIPAELPNVGRLRDWTQDIGILLRAYDWPYWSEEYPVRTTLLGVTNSTASVSVTGNTDTCLEAEIMPRGGTLTALTLGAQGQTMTLTGLSVAQGTTLRIWRDTRHLLRIDAGGAGLMSHRTGDDLTLSPGQHEVTITANTACDAVLSARGCYL